MGTFLKPVSGERVELSDFYMPTGRIATKGEFVEQMKRDTRVVAGPTTIEVAGANLMVWSFFSVPTGVDIDGNPLIFKCVVDGDPALHPTYHGKIFRFATSAEAVTKHDAVVAAIKDGKAI